MKFYVDDTDHSNLHKLSHPGKGIDDPLTFDNPSIIHIAKDVGFIPDNTKKYNENGIYFVSVRCYADMWSGKYERGNPRHVLYELSGDVIDAARKGKVIIVIDNQSEGLPLIYNNVNGYIEMHKAMKNLRLPKYSVLFVDSNAHFLTEYTRWCLENDCHPFIAHVYFITGFYYFVKGVPNNPLVLHALNIKKSKDFNSLNRTVRQHRIEHLYYLASKNLIKNGIVSGHYSNNPRDMNVPDSHILEVPYLVFSKMLKENLPLIADKNVMIENPDHDEETIFNHSIYKNSLLSFVTETAFHQPGMFITEKTFKPIVAGHPFIILGQHSILKELNKMGYKTDFPGIDQSYDDIIDPVDRFHAAHNSLIKWVNTSRKDKEMYLRQSLKILKYNQNVFKSRDHTYESYKRLLKTTQEIFAGTYRNNEKNKLC